LPRRSEAFTELVQAAARQMIAARSVLWPGPWMRGFLGIGREWKRGV